MTPRDYLASLEFHGIKLGLDNILALLRHAGDPQDAYPSIHVAGTNGKGSVIAFLDAMLRAAGYRTGRFTSPHLIDVSERFLVEGVPIMHADLDDQIERFRETAEANDIPATYFEMVTAIAFNYFKKAKVDVALIEVGLGGRFDATNVLNPLATAITPIDLDHMQYLGDTIKEIAGEKAGILKPGVPAIIGETRSPAIDVVLARAAELGAPIVLRNRDFRLSSPRANQSYRYESDAWSIEVERLGLAGAFQADNAAIATALAESIRPRFPNLTTKAVESGLAAATWPCRLERVLESPPVIVDSAHNPAAFEAIAHFLPRGIVILSVSKDKHADAMVRIAEQFAERLILTQYDGPRAMSGSALAGLVAKCPFEVAQDIEAALDLALAQASTSAPIIIVGSIFAAGEARRHLIQRYGAPPLRF